MMRLQKLDILRGVLILIMIIFHTNFLLNAVFFIDTKIPFVILKTVQIIGASLFISLAGFSFALSENKNSKTLNNFYFKRVGILFILSLLISIFTYIFMIEQFISFGILHFFTLAFFLLIFFQKIKYWNLLFGFVFIVIGILISNIIFNFKYLFWLGFLYPGFTSADFYPIFPWFGVILFGYCLGYFLIKKDLLEKVFGGNFKNTFGLKFLGQNSLIIYLIHVPIIYVILNIIFSR